MKQILPILFLSFLVSSGLFAQLDTLTPPDLQELIEDFYQNTETDADFDFNTLLEELEYFRRRPLNLNRANENDLRALQLLDDRQIADLLLHRERFGNLIAVYELQAIPSFDRFSILRILPFVTTGGDLDQNQATLPILLSEGDHELFLRYTRILQDQRGYRPFDPENPDQSRYLGNQDRYYMRYRYRSGRDLSYGLTAEKDPGEQFFKGVNKEGFDYYSAHFFLRDRGRVKALALGDFTVSLGQGLVLNSGFFGGKSSNTIRVNQRNAALRPYTSVNETSFLRGAGLTYELSDQIELTGFVSYNRQDGNLVEQLSEGDSISEIPLLGFSSILNTGFHRTPNEIADKNSLRQFTTGGRVAYDFGRGGLNANLVYNRFDRSLTPNTTPYRQFVFSGNSLLNVSLDYHYRLRNLNFFGETARSDNGGLAFLHGLSLPLDRRVGISLVHRHYEQDYQVLNARPFGEGSNGQNEAGLYMGIRVQPVQRWELSAYFDTFRFPWLRFRTDAPSRGYEWLARLTYNERRRITVYAEVRREIKPQNSRISEFRFDRITDRDRLQFRLHLQNSISRRLTLRTRFQYGFLQFADDPQPLRGYMLYQDLNWRPQNLPLSFSTRFAIFDTEDFELRFYSFENDLLYAFSVPAYFGRGSRFYLNTRWRLSRSLTVEGRYAQTRFLDRDQVGSGLETIEGNTRSEVKFQLRYRF